MSGPTSSSHSIKVNDFPPSANFSFESHLSHTEGAFNSVLVVFKVRETLWPFTQPPSALLEEEEEEEDDLTIHVILQDFLKEELKFASGFP